MVISAAADSVRLAEMPAAGDSFQGWMAAIGAAELHRTVTNQNPGLLFTPQGSMILSAMPDNLARSIQAHAARHAAPSWLWADWIDGKPLFSTRRASADWAALLAAQQDAMPQGWDSLLDQRMIRGLGMPRGLGLDSHMSPAEVTDAPMLSNPLDMIPRNAGGEIISRRLRKLAPVVAALSPEAITADLCNLDVGEWSINWGPAPVPPARAWCALWALAQFRVDLTRRRRVVRPVVPGHDRAPGDEWVAVPIFDGPFTLNSWGDVLASEQLRTVATESRGAGHDDPSVSYEAMRAWADLSRIESGPHTLSVAGLLVYPIEETRPVPLNVVRRILKPARVRNPAMR